MKIVQQINSDLTRTTPISVPDNTEVIFDQQSKVISKLETFNKEMSSKIDELQAELDKSELKSKLRFWAGLTGSFICTIIGFLLGKYFG